MAYEALDVAKLIVNKAISNGTPISNLKLQKIMYFVQRDYLKGNKGKPIFSDDIEAWQFGPVVPTVYYKYCTFGSMPITSEYSIEEELKESDEKFILDIYKDLKDKNAWDLVHQTHKPDGPWKEIYKEGQGNHHVIPIALIAEKG